VPADDVAILREAFARFEHDGVPSFEVIDPELEIINFDSFPVTEPYDGWEGALQWLVDLSAPFDGFRFELIDVLGHDDERVVTTLRARGDSRIEGPAFELVWGAVWTFRDGKIVRTEGFRTAEEALKAAGRFEDLEHRLR
jgi:ketosteroid isomerase-like protein